MTVAELVKQALRVGNLVDAESTPSAGQITQGREALNSLLYQLSAETNGVFAVTRETFTLVAGTAEYAIGDSQTLDTTRPTRIISAFVRDGSTDYRVQLESGSDYAQRGDKTITGIPSRLYYEAGYPAGALVFFPVPDKAYSLILHSQKPLAQYATNTDNLNLPPEYEPALKWALHVALCGEYGREPSQIAVSFAQRTMDALKSLHSVPVPRARSNPFGGGGRYDINGDTYL